jgi:5-methylcytosine-specific restriction endonuclease McrA
VSTSLKGRPRRTAIAHVRSLGQPCWLCGFPIDQSLDFERHRMASTVDERTPRSRGGSATDHANLAHAHRLCNSIRGDRDVTGEVRHECRTAAAKELGITVTSPGTTSREW